MSAIVSGKAVTEEKMVSAIKAHEANRKRPGKATAKGHNSKLSTRGRSITTKDVKSSTKGKKTQKPKHTSISEPTPGPSGLCKSTGSGLNVDADESQSSEDEIPEEEKCCVCHKYTPDEVRHSVSIIFPKWVQSDRCPHWTHLIYCTKTRIIRQGDSFFHCHCSSEE